MTQIDLLKLRYQTVNTQRTETGEQMLGGVI